jgi:hypothetical protein
MLSTKKIQYKDESVKKYLYEQKRNKKLYGAGRGWYSGIETPFVLDTEPVQDIIDLLEKQYPLLSFSCWSTEEIKSYFHHIQTRFVTFVNADKDYLKTIFEFLKGTNPSIYLNPTQFEIKKSFNIEQNTIIIRPSISKEPVQNHLAKIEKILIDLFVETDKTALIDKWEFGKLFDKLVFTNRISIASLAAYSIRRKVKEQIKHFLKDRDIY